MDGVISDVTDLEELHHHVKLFPNPTNSSFMLQTDFTGRYSVLVTTIDGRMMLERHNLNGETRIDASNWHQGIYLVRVIDNTDNSSSLTKLVKID